MLEHKAEMCDDGRGVQEGWVEDPEGREGLGGEVLFLGSCQGASQGGGETEEGG